MDSLIHIVGDELGDWEEDLTQTNRYSIFTQNIMLAERVSKGQHLTPRSSKLAVDDGSSYYSADSQMPNITPTNSTTHQSQDAESLAPAPLAIQANIDRARTRGRHQMGRTSSPGDWTWQPIIPQRISSMKTRSDKGSTPWRPDLATFHRRSCQLFSSLDSTLSNATSTHTNSSTASDESQASTSPSLASSVTTQATSVLDDNWIQSSAFPSFHLDLQDPRLSYTGSRVPAPDSGELVNANNHASRLASPRSSSQLSPKITTTAQIFWTSDATRQAEYAKIDAAHTGIRGFIKRLLPKSWTRAHGKRRNFYQRASAAIQFDSPDLDQDSVRRLRINIASATQEAIADTERRPISRPHTPLPRVSTGEPETRVSVDGTDTAPTTKSVKSRPTYKIFTKVRSSEALAKVLSSSATKND